jgi:uncharacterized protein YgiM (DUF1202 family)
MPKLFRPRLVGRVVSERETSYPDPLEVVEGEKVTVGERDEEWSGFLWCANPAGKGGWVPEDYVEPSGDVGVMRCDYTARELNISVGEELVLHKSESGWYWATNNEGESGWVPANHIELVESMGG